MAKELLLKTMKKNDTFHLCNSVDQKTGLHIFPVVLFGGIGKKTITFIFKKVSHNKLYLSKTQWWVKMVHLGTKHKLLLFEKYYCLVFYCLFYCYKTNVHCDFTVVVIILGYRWDRAYKWSFLPTAYWYIHPYEIVSASWRDASG